MDGVVIGGLYLPNGNPYPGPKFEYKLRWFKRLHDYAAELLELEVPVVPVGDYNVMPTELDVYKPERWTDDALFRIEVREAYRNLVSQAWTEALREMHPGERIYTFWDYFRNAYGRDAGLRFDHFLLSPDLAERLKKMRSTSMFPVESTPAITRRCGLSYPTNRSNGGNEMSNDWRDEFRSGLANLVDQAVVSGAKHADVFNATIEEIERLRIANERDPDPADDVSDDNVEKPANDSPAASA